MEAIRKIEPLLLLLVIIGALNWGIFGITGGSTNVVSEIFGTGTLSDIIYVIVGVAGILLIPRLVESFRMGGSPEPRGT